MDEEAVLVIRDRGALPGQVLTIVGAVIIWALFGWTFAVAFGIGGILGSTRYNPPQPKEPDDDPILR